MGAMASQITSLTIVCSTVHSGADHRKHQSSASLAFVWGIHPAQMVGNAENVSIWWRHHAKWNFQCIWIQHLNPYTCILLNFHPEQISHLLMFVFFISSTSNCSVNYWGYRGMRHQLDCYRRINLFLSTNLNYLLFIAFLFERIMITNCDKLVQTGS